MLDNNTISNETPSNPHKTNYDSPWKQIIEELLESFLEFFFPKIFKDIDFSRGYEVKRTLNQKQEIQIQNLTSKLP